jgi:hypothetical protein
MGREFIEFLLAKYFGKWVVLFWNIFEWVIICFFFMGNMGSLGSRDRK